MFLYGLDVFSKVRSDMSKYIGLLTYLIGEEVEVEEAGKFVRV